MKKFILRYVGKDFKTLEKGVYMSIWKEIYKEINKKY